jgi:hypothetical protein
MRAWHRLIWRNPRYLHIVRGSPCSGGHVVYSIPCLPILRRQRRPPAASRGLQSQQFHANAGNPEDGGAVIADQLARATDQDRRQGREPRS